MPERETRDVDPDSAGDENASAPDSASSAVSSHQSPPPDFPPPPPKAGSRGSLHRIVKKMDSLCLKTNLDLEACRKVADEFSVKKEAQLREIIQSAPVEPFKPRQPLENYLVAAPCKARWESMSGVETFKICHQCGLHVYDFSGMDLSKVKELVVKREEKENPVFFRRKDGTFLTTDCPIGVKQKRTTIMMVAGGAVLVAVIIGAILLAPPPPPTVTTNQTISVPAEEKAGSAKGGQGAIGTAGQTSGSSANSTGYSNSSQGGIDAGAQAKFLMSLPGGLPGAQAWHPAQPPSSSSATETVQPGPGATYSMPPGTPAPQATGTSTGQTAISPASSSVPAGTSFPPTSGNSTASTAASPATAPQQQVPASAAAQGTISEPAQQPSPVNSSQQPVSPYVRNYK